MSRIVTNVQSLVAQRVLGGQNRALNQSLTRLSTGLRINTGADDPAGLIASESLRAEKVAIGAAIGNARRAENVLSIAEGGLQEINRLMLDLEDLIDRSASEAGLSQAEVDANQLQIDAILQSIDRIANTTEFNGLKLLGGSFDFTTSGVSTTNVSNVQVNAAKLPPGATRAVTVDVITGSTFAQVSATGLGGSGTLASATTIQVRGSLGTEVLSFASGTTQAFISNAVNASKNLTGVSAVVSTGGSTDAIYLTSTTYGTNAIVAVEVLDGTNSLDVAGGTTANAAGTDGTITVNGMAANVDGLNISTRTGTLNVDLALTAAFGGSTTATSSSFYITGGGALFNIAPAVSLVGMETIGLQSVSTGSLGDSAGGFLSTLASGSTNDLGSRNYATAQQILHRAQDQVSGLRGRIGGFQRNTLATSVNSLLIALENTAAAESAIRETDFAETTSALTRAQILVQTATATLQLANSQPQTVLTLLQ